ncbi:MAG: hypothetical protein FWH20_07105 [Oscillospiraceae bacterium]|nr:hypothetical protein [Oscillospiraceae bacterium]
MIFKFHNHYNTFLSKLQVQFQKYFVLPKADKLSSLVGFLIALLGVRVLIIL